MIRPDEYVRHDALALAGLVRRGEVSAAELLEAAIARIEAHNPALNAVVRKRYDAARAEASRGEPGRLGGAVGRRALSGEGPAGHAGRRAHRQRQPGAGDDAHAA